MGTAREEHELLMARGLNAGHFKPLGRVIKCRSPSCRCPRTVPEVGRLDPRYDKDCYSSRV